MASKAIIKAIPAALKAEDWKGAEDKCRSVLQFDPTNYNVNTFLGLALFRQGRVDEAEACYKEAIAVEAQKKDRKGDNPNAWSGLVNALEAQKRVDEYMEAAMKLAVIYRDLDDRTRCQTAVDKITPFVKENGSKEQYKRALHLLLPESPIFDFLEGRIPHPSLTLQKLIDIIEAEEKEKINKEIASRRSRLGVRPGQVARAVKREVLGASPLENLYHQILNWSDDEELRRTIDTKLLQHGYDKLLVVDKEEKDAERAKVYKWAEGLVILKYPFELAWKIVIEWKDCESIGEHDVNILREYIQFFPESGLSKALSAYLKSELSPFPIPVQVDEDGNPVEKEPTAEEDSPDELIDAMIEGLEKSPNSILCHRIVAEYYLTLNEYEQAIDVSRNAQKLIAAESARINIPFLKNNDVITVILATAQIHYQSPKYHPEARAAFENVLTRKTTYGAALVGLGLILEEQQNYEMAGDLLRKAFALDPENVKTRAEAAWCDVLIGKHDEGKEELERCADLVGGLDPRSRDLKAQITWRIGMAVWNGHEDLRADRKHGPYSFFITALHNNQNFAPAYTSLGIYYEDIVNDTARANKCFQKAFELSAGEVEAAERLARSFADSKEWELVEIIARRVAEADQKRSVPGKGMSWPHSAIGVVELNAQNYALAIQSFQAALRVAPNDYNAWVGLGEAYASSGKWVAATKVFVQAEKIDSSSWFPKYMLANVNRELGEYEAACAGYRAVLDLQPGEYGVLVALSETLSASAWHYVEKGYFGRAANASVESLQVAEKVVKERPDAFNLWKTVGDCCFIFSWVQSLTEKFPKELVSRILSEDIDISEFDIMADVDGAGSNTLEKFEQLNDLTTCLHMGILAYKRGIYASADDRHAHAVAWFNLGCAEYRTYASLPARPMKYRHAAISCFKRTIKLEPGNHEFWNALGVATGELNAKVAQHALVRALYINEKNARVWVNLGALYILMGDMEIANQAFSKAQSADPEYALAWVGQAVIAQMLGETQEALELYSHAFEISESSSVLVKRQFSTATFDRITKLDSSTAFSSLLGPIFALQKLQEQISSEPVSLRLNALFNERVQEFAPAAVRLEIVCSTVEQRYEETESEEDLIRYAQAKTDLARVRLGLKEYEAAVENASLALDLSGDTESLKNCRLSAHLTAGLAHYYLGAMEDSLEMFKAALTESNENPDVVCLLSQVLWAKGGDEERDVARDQLFACIEKHPDHLQSTLLLGAIGVLDNNEDVVDAVMDDLQAVCGDDKIDKTSREKVDKLLSLIGQLMKPDQNISIAGTSVFLRPFSSSTWSKLLTASPEPSYHAADMALKVAVQGKVDAEELCHAFSQIGVLSYDQKAIMVAPWKADGWRGMVADINSANAATAAG